jgi:hypothetical protein
MGSSTSNCAVCCDICSIYNRNSPSNEPNISGFKPYKALEGETVEIRGGGFTGTTTVNFNGTPAQFAPLGLFKLILNGTDRFKERPGEYFRLAQNYTHHTRIPGNYIYTYSFALRPEEHQPSGTCNFSRVDTSQLYILLRSTSDPTNGGLYVVPAQNYNGVPPEYSLYAPSYNILRIMGGMGGLAYNN